MPDATQSARRRKLGLCVACGQHDHVAARSKCQSCLAADKARAASRRDKAARIGLCEACMVAPRCAGRGNRCDQCAEKYNARKRKDR